MNYKSYSVTADLDLESKYLHDFFLYMVNREKQDSNLGKQGNFKNHSLIESHESPLSFTSRIYKGVELILIVRFNFSELNGKIRVNQVTNSMIDKSWSENDVEQLKAISKQQLEMFANDFKMTIEE